MLKFLIIKRVGKRSEISNKQCLPISSFFNDVGVNMVQHERLTAF